MRSFRSPLQWLASGASALGSAWPGAAWAAGEGGAPAAVVGVGLAIGLGGAMLLYRDARRSRRREALHAADVAALRAAYAQLESAKLAAERQAAQVGATLAGMSDGVMVLDADLRVVQWNDRFAEIAGVPAGLLKLGTPMEALIRGQAEAGEFGPMEEAEAEVARRMALVREFPVFGVVERVRPNGRAMELRRTKLPDGGMVTLYTDITARKQAEALQLAVRAAEAAAIAQKRQFLAMVSHELRVPLDALISSLALVDAGRLADGPRALVETARRAGAALRDLIGDILNLSSLDAGRLVLRAAPFDPAALLGEVGDMFAAAAGTRGLTIGIVVGKDVPARMQGDAGRLRQVVMNLVSNATKFSAPGAVTIAIARMPGGGEAVSELMFSVADAGPVISSDQAAKLFQPFARLDPALEAGVPGSGLGLAICAQLVGLIGGRIGLAVEDGRNRFWFTVPLALPGMSGAPTPADLVQRTLRRARILLVEDVAANRQLTAALLRRDGHMVDVAENGLEAVRLAGSRVYDVVLMDIHMPGIDGIEAARRIRALAGPAGRVPIIAVTGSSGDHAPDQKPVAGMDAMLVKPVPPDTLIAMLRRFLMPEMAALSARMRTAPTAGVLDTTRIAALRDGLAPGMFFGLVEQCLADIARRLPALDAALAQGGASPILGAAHALAGMAGSYGLAAFERRMRAVMAAAAEGDFAATAELAAGAAADLAQGGLEMRAFLRGVAP